METNAKAKVAVAKTPLNNVSGLRTLAENVVQTSAAKTAISKPKTRPSTNDALLPKETLILIS